MAESEVKKKAHHLNPTTKKEAKQDIITSIKTASQIITKQGKRGTKKTAKKQK